MKGLHKDSIDAIADHRQFGRFFGVSLVGTAADYVLALALYQVFGLPGMVASALAFFAGAAVNYLGHALVTFRRGGPAEISLAGFARYLWAVGLSLVVRLGSLFVLGLIAALPFWFALACAFAASFLTSYLVSALWVFRKE